MKVVAEKRDKLEKAKSLLTRMLKEPTKADVCQLIESSNACPFGWQHNQYRCFCCSETFLEIKELRKHSEEDHSRDQMILQAYRLRKGASIKADITRLQCSLCITSVETLDSLKAHLASDHGLKFSDENNDPLVPFNLDGGTFQCQLCSESFLGFHSLNMHMNRHFQKHICESCGAGFANLHCLSAHKSRHKSSKFECRLCKATFPNHYKKHSHMVLVHKSRLLHKCPQCPERFKEHYTRARHMQAAHGAARTEHACGSCEKLFPRKSSLNAHVRSVHLNERNHECGVCANKFFRKADLTKHMASHGGERKYACDACGKSFSRKDALTQHAKSHARGVVGGGGRTACSRCGVSFVQQTALRLHMRTEHAEENLL